MSDEKIAVIPEVSPEDEAFFAAMERTGWIVLPHGATPEEIHAALNEPEAG